jgi:N4-gp56 family major capsid protein
MAKDEPEFGSNAHLSLCQRLKERRDASSFMGMAPAMLANETKTTSTGISDVQPSSWSDLVVLYSQPYLKFIDAVIQNRDLVGSGEVTLKWPLASSNITLANSKSEAATRTMTEMTNLTAATFTPAWVGGGVAVSQETVLTTRFGVLNFAKQQIALYRATKIDGDIGTALAGASNQGSAIGAGAYVNNVNQLAAGDVLIPSLVNKARAGIKSYNFDPKLLYVAPQQEQALMDDPQFINSAQYGSNEVVLNGEIGKYLGLKAIVSTQVPSFSNGGSGGTLAGHTCVLVDPSKAAGLVWKEEGAISTQYFPDERLHKIYLDMMYAVGTLQTRAIGTIKVLDV